jgi:hypothetical protein
LDTASAVPSPKVSTMQEGSESFKTVTYKKKTTTDAPVVNTVKHHWQPFIGVQSYYCCYYYLHYFLLILYYSLKPQLISLIHCLPLVPGIFPVCVQVTLSLVRASWSTRPVFLSGFSPFFCYYLLGRGFLFMAGVLYLLFVIMRLSDFSLLFWKLYLINRYVTYLLARLRFSVSSTSPL